MQRLGLAVVLAAWLPATAGAQVMPVQTAEHEARAYFALGQNHFKNGEYDAAVGDFQAGYRALPLPLFLFNIGQAAAKAGKPELAVEYYQRYLDAETHLDAPQLPIARQHPPNLRPVVNGS